MYIFIHFLLRGGGVKGASHLRLRINLSEYSQESTLSIEF